VPLARWGCGQTGVSIRSGNYGQTIGMVKRSASPPSWSLLVLRLMTSRRAIGAILLLLLAACSVETPTLEDLPPGLMGTVTDSVSGRRVSEARVTVQNKSATTDSNGLYSIGNLQAGTSLVRVTHPSYRDAERQVRINALLSPGDFVLEPR
jgi:Carboxypeptidase regulatory-like domain